MQAVVVEQLAVGRQRTDDPAAIGLLDARQLTQPADVDELRRLGEPQLHERQEAVASGDGGRIGSREEVERLVDR